jgi:hypothetical protein
MACSGSGNTYVVTKRLLVNEADQTVNIKQILITLIVSFSAFVSKPLPAMDRDGTDPARCQIGLPSSTGLPMPSVEENRMRPSIASAIAGSVHVGQPTRKTAHSAKIALARSCTWEELMSTVADVRKWHKTDEG